MQDLDARADQLRHRRRTLPELTELAEHERTRSDLDGRARDAQVSVDDLAAEQAKIDADVEQARGRRARDQEKIDQGVVSNPKDLQRMLHELESLDRRITTLEDQELEVMEQVEDAGKQLQSLQAELAATEERITALAAVRDEKIAAIDEELAKVAAERESTVEGVTADLLALYERLREQKEGVGAAALRAGQCEGCRLTLDPAELAQIRAAADDDVLRCEQCMRILVRTAESGL